MALGEKFLLGSSRVHEHHVRVAAAGDVERLSGAERDDADLDSRLLFEHGKQMPEETGLLGRRRRGNGDEALPRMGVMMLAAGKGSRITLETDGPDETEAMDAIVVLIGDCFGEGQ